MQKKTTVLLSFLIIILIEPLYDIKAMDFDREEDHTSGNNTSTHLEDGSQNTRAVATHASANDGLSDNDSYSEDDSTQSSSSHIFEVRHTYSKKNDKATFEESEDDDSLLRLRNIARKFPQAERFILKQDGMGMTCLVPEEESPRATALSISAENLEATHTFQKLLQAKYPTLEVADFFQDHQSNGLESYPALSAKKIQKVFERIDQSFSYKEKEDVIKILDRFILENTKQFYFYKKADPLWTQYQHALNDKIIATRNIQILKQIDNSISTKATLLHADLAKEAADALKKKETATIEANKLQSEASAEEALAQSAEIQKRKALFTEFYPPIASHEKENWSAWAKKFAPAEERDTASISKLVSAGMSNPSWAAQEVVNIWEKRMLITSGKIKKEAEENEQKMSLLNKDLYRKTRFLQTAFDKVRETQKKLLKVKERHDQLEKELNVSLILSEQHTEHHATAEIEAKKEALQKQLEKKSSALADASRHMQQLEGGLVEATKNLIRMKIPDEEHRLATKNTLSRNLDRSFFLLEKDLTRDDAQHFIKASSSVSLTTEYMRKIREITVLNEVSPDFLYVQGLSSLAQQTIEEARTTVTRALLQRNPDFQQAAKLAEQAASVAEKEHNNLLEKWSEKSVPDFNESRIFESSSREFKTPSPTLPDEGYVVINSPTSIARTTPENSKKKRIKYEKASNRYEPFISNTTSTTAIRVEEALRHPKIGHPLSSQELSKAYKTLSCFFIQCEQSYFRIIFQTNALWKMYYEDRFLVKMQFKKFDKKQSKALQTAWNTAINRQDQAKSLWEYTKYNLTQLPNLSDKTLLDEKLTHAKHTSVELQLIANKHEKEIGNALQKTTLASFIITHTDAHNAAARSLDLDKLLSNAKLIHVIFDSAHFETMHLLKVLDSMNQIECDLYFYKILNEKTDTQINSLWPFREALKGYFIQLDTIFERLSIARDEQASPNLEHIQKQISEIKTVATQLEKQMGSLIVKQQGLAQEHQSDLPPHKESKHQKAEESISSTTTFAATVIEGVAWFVHYLQENVLSDK